MARPTKLRKIENVPKVLLFVPSDKTDTDTDENVLKMEEIEAIRLKDLLGLEQEECAGRMGVSRPTFQRILLSAREKIADSLVKGKAVRIEGGNFTRNICLTRCLDCANEWEMSFEKMENAHGNARACPQCSSKNITCCQNGSKFCKRNCKRHGRDRE